MYAIQTCSYYCDDVMPMITVSSLLCGSVEDCQNSGFMHVLRSAMIEEIKVVERGRSVRSLHTQLKTQNFPLYMLLVYYRLNLSKGFHHLKLKSFIQLQ